MSSITLIHAKWIVPIIPKETSYEDYSIAIEGKRIVDILPFKEAQEKYKESKGVFLNEDHIVMPGLVNMHCHSPMSLLRGFADDVPLMEWLLV